MTPLFIKFCWFLTFSSMIFFSFLSLISGLIYFYILKKIDNNLYYSLIRTDLTFFPSGFPIELLKLKQKSFKQLYFFQKSDNDKQILLKYLFKITTVLWLFFFTTQLIIFAFFLS